MQSFLDKVAAAAAAKTEQGEASKPGAAYFRSSWQNLRLLVRVPSGHAIPEIRFQDYCLIITEKDPEAALKLDFLRNNVMKRDNIFTINELTKDEFDMALSIQENPPLPQADADFEPFVDGKQAGSDLSPEELRMHLEEMKLKQELAAKKAAEDELNKKVNT